MAEALTSTAPPAPAVPELRRIGMADLRDALVARRSTISWPRRRSWSSLGCSIPIIGFVAARAAWGGPLLPLLYPLLAGLVADGAGDRHRPV